MDRIRPYNLKPLWDKIMNVYAEFKSICERHNLRHCAAYGTVLGAIRHKGFIPWDDDFDLFMPRPDYERFIEFARKEAPSHLRVITYDSDKSYDGMWVTFRDMRDDVLEHTRRISGIDLVGIYIDVFPLDGMPSSWLGAQWFRFRNFLLQAARRSLDVHKVPLFSLSGMKVLCGRLVRLFYPSNYGNKDFLRKIEMLYKKLPYDNSSMLGFGYYVNQREGMWRFRREIIGMPQYVPFADTTLPVPEKAEIYLEGCYGDWRRLPQEDDRRPKHAKKGA